MLLASSATQDALAVGETRSLRMVHSHTGETISITYKSGGSFDSSALEKLNWFLRDWRVDEPISMSPHLFDIVWHVYREVGASDPIKIMSAYRSPGTNAMLRRRSRAVAKESQHMRGNAMDIHIPGVSVAKVREIGLRLQRGGVGYYPSAGSPFVHLDVGSVRHWPKMSRDQLARLFPDGKTVHIPADGRPMENYQAALAEVQARGGSALDYATVSSGKSLWALLFGGGADEEEDRAPVAPARGRGRNAPTRVADARSARSSVPAGGGGSSASFDNPMNPGIVQPVEVPVQRPVAVAALPQRAEPRPPEPKAEATAAKEDLLAPRFTVATNMPLPPARPRGAAFAQLVASAEPSSLPLPPLRPAGLGAVAAAPPAAAPAQAHAATTAEAARPALALATGVPLPPSRPASLPGVIRSGEASSPAASPAAAPVPVQAYAAVAAPLPPQRSAALSPAPALRVQPPAPALDVGRANARGSGQRPLSIPAAVTAKAPDTRAAPALAQGFAAQKHLPSLGFSGSFVREIDAAGGFRRAGQ